MYYVVMFVIIRGHFRIWERALELRRLAACILVDFVPLRIPRGDKMKNIGPMNTRSELS